MEEHREGNALCREVKKTLPVGVINHGDGSEKRCPSLYETTGNEIYRHGQRFLHKLPSLFLRNVGILNFFFARAFIYMRMRKKKAISDSWALVRSAFFLSFFAVKKNSKFSYPDVAIRLAARLVVISLVVGLADIERRCGQEEGVHLVAPVAQELHHPFGRGLLRRVAIEEAAAVLRA